MTTLNVIAAVATVDFPAAPAEHAFSDGAAFGAVLDHVMQMTRHVATTATATHPAKPAESRASATGEFESIHHLFKLAPAEEAASEESPSGAEIALPIEALSSYLAAFIALFAQTMPPAEAAEATAEAVEGSDLAVAALGVSVTGSTPTDGGDVTAVFAQLAATGEGADDASLAELFSTLLDGADDALALQIADRAAEGATLREMVAELTASLAGAEDARALAAELQTQVQVQPSAAPVQSIDQLVEVLTQLAATVRAGVGATDQGNAQVAAAVASVTGASSQSDDASFAWPADALSPRTLAEAPNAVAHVANLVATLTREISAAVRPMVESDVSGAVAQPSQVAPQLRETNVQVLVALAESAQGLQAARINGSAQVTIQLTPESLGKVTIEVERTSEGVVARVAAATPEAQRAIADNAQSVKDALAGIGLAVSKLEVSGPSTAGQPKGFEAVLAAVAPVVTAPSQVSTTPTIATQTRPLQGASTQTVAAAETAEVEQPPVADAEVVVDENVPSGTAPAPNQPPVARADAPAVTPESGGAARSGVANLVRDIADQAGVLASQGKSEFQIQLRPDTLGRLNIRMTLEGGEVTVQMRAESAQAKSAIESGLGQLKQSFQEQGIRVDRFEVVVAQGQLAQEHGHPRRSRGLVDEARRRRSGRDDGEFAGVLASATRPVDFRA
jgi:flagellar hook-length control protein FliK